MIDSKWFYQQLQQDGRSLRHMAKALSLDPSSLSRMLRGERKMSAEEQDGIADYLGMSIVEVIMRRRGKTLEFAERGQEPLDMDIAPKGNTLSRRLKLLDTDRNADDNLFNRIRTKMAGTVTIPPGVDLTEPPEPEWARVYDDDYEYPLHL